MHYINNYTQLPNKPKLTKFFSIWEILRKQYSQIVKGLFMKQKQTLYEELKQYPGFFLITLECL